MGGIMADARQNSGRPTRPAAESRQNLGRIAAEMGQSVPILPAFCRSSAAGLPEFCRCLPWILPVRVFCRWSAAGLPLFCRFSRHFFLLFLFFWRQTRKSARRRRRRPPPAARRPPPTPRPTAASVLSPYTRRPLAPPSPPARGRTAGFHRSKQPPFCWSSHPPTVSRARPARSRHATSRGPPLHWPLTSEVGTAAKGHAGNGGGARGAVKDTGTSLPDAVMSWDVAGAGGREGEPATRSLSVWPRARKAGHLADLASCGAACDERHLACALTSPLTAPRLAFLPLSATAVRTNANQPWRPLKSPPTMRTTPRRPPPPRRRRPPPRRRSSRPRMSATSL